MAIMGGEDSKVNANFLDAYSKIAGEGKPAKDQIQAIRDSVDNKLVNAQEQVDPTGQLRKDEKMEGRRTLSGLEQFSAGAKDTAESLASSGGDFFFGEDTGEDPMFSPRSVGRIVANLPGGIISTIPNAASAITSPFTDFTYYDPETQSIPEGDLGSHSLAGAAANIGSVGIDAASIVAGGGIGRGVAGAVKGGANALGKGVSSKFGNGLAKEGDSFMGSVNKGFKNGLKKPDYEPTNVVTRTIANVGDKVDKFGEKNMFARGLTTAAEEMGQETIQGGLEWVASNDDAIRDGELTADDWKNLGDNLAYSAYGGAVGGGVFGTLGGINEQRQLKKAEKAEAAAVAAAPAASSKPSSLADSAVDNRFEGRPDAYVPADVAAEVYAEEAKQKIGGQSATATTSDVDVNGFDLGFNTMSALYGQEKAKASIDKHLGEQAMVMNIDLEAAFYDPDNYAGGAAQAIRDLNRVIKASGPMEALVWKDPANGKQVKLYLRQLIEGEQIGVNSALAKLYNGDFDTDALTFSFDQAIVGKALAPTAMLIDNDVTGKVNLDLEKTSFKGISEVKQYAHEIALFLEARDSTMSAANANRLANNFIKEYEIAGNNNESRAIALARFLARDGSILSNQEAGYLFDQFQAHGDPIQNAIDESNIAIASEMERSTKKSINQTGAVPRDTSPLEMLVKTGQSDPNKPGKPLRKAAAWLFQNAKAQGADHFSLGASQQYALAHQRITQLGTKPQEVLKRVYRGRVIQSLENKMKGSPFKSQDDFSMVMEVLNEERKPYEEAQTYKAIDGEHVFEEFVGPTAPIENPIGSIKGFQQIFGAFPFADYFILPDAVDGGIWAEATIDEVFNEMARSEEGAVNAFSHYGIAFERLMFNGIKSTYQSTVRKSYNRLEEGAKEVTERKLHPDPQGMIPKEEIGIFNARWNFICAALKKRVTSLGLIGYATLDKFGPSFYDKGMLAEDPDVLIRMMASLTVIDENQDLMLLVKEYNKDMSQENAEAVSTEALKHMRMMSPPYQLIAAEILDSLEVDGPIEPKIYKMLSSLHDMDTLSTDQLTAFFTNVYKDQDIKGSYENLIVDLMISADDEIALGQLNNDFTNARIYSRRASMTNQELSKLRWNEFKEAARTFGDSNDAMVWTLAEMSMEPQLWDDMVVSEALRQTSFISNVTKEKARAELFSKIAQAGRAFLHGGQKTQEDLMFRDRAYKVKADNFFSDPFIIPSLLFGPLDTVVSVEDTKGKTRTMRRKDLFEWATGEAYNDTEDKAVQDQQTFLMVDRKPMLVDNFLPSTFSVSVTESVKRTSRQSAKQFYEERRGKRNETFVAARDKRALKSAFQEDLEAIRFIGAMMSEANEGRPLPTTKPHEYLKLYSQAVNNLVDAVYYNMTVTTEQQTAANNGRVAKIQSRAKATERLSRVLIKRALAKADNYSPAESMLFNEIMESAAVSVVGSLMGLNMPTSNNFVGLGADGLLLDIRNQYDIAKMRLDAELSNLSLLETRNIATPDKIRNLTKARFSQMSDVEIKKMLKDGGRLDSTGNAIDTSLNDANGTLDTVLARKGLIDEIELRFADIAVDDVTNANFINFDISIPEMDEMPGTLEEMMKVTDPDVIFKNINPTIGEGQNTTNLYAAVQELMRRSKSAKSTVDAVQAQIEKINKDKAEAIRKQIAALGAAAFNPDKSFSQAAIDISAGATRYYDLRIARITGKSYISAQNTIAEIQAEYEGLIKIKNDYKYYMLITRMQHIANPMNVYALTDLDSLNDQFLDFVDKYRNNFIKEDQELREPEYPPAGAEQGKVFIPQFGTLDPVIKDEITSMEANLFSGDVEIGTALAAIGSGRRSLYGQMGGDQPCRAPGTQMTYAQAKADPDVISIRVETDDGARVVPAPRGTASLIDRLGNQVKRNNGLVIAYKKNECTCGGGCSNHNVGSIINAKTANNNLASFFAKLSYYMEEVEQLQKKKALKSGKDAKPLFADVAANEDLRPTEHSSADINEVLAACRNFQSVLELEFVEDIKNNINKMSKEAQSMLLDPHIFAKDLAEFCTRFVQINVHLDNGTIMSEYHLKNLGLEARIVELSAVPGVQPDGVKVVPFLMVPEISEQATLRYMKEKNDSTEATIMEGFQNEGAKIQVLKDGTLGYADSVTHFPEQLNLDDLYNMTDILKPGKSDLPFGPDQVNAWMQYVAPMNNYENAKQSPEEAFTPITKIAPTEASRNDLINAADFLGLNSNGNQPSMLINLDASRALASGDEELLSLSTTSFALSDSSSTQFGLNAKVMLPPPGYVGSIYLPYPTADSIKAYHTWAMRAVEHVLIYIPKQHEGVVIKSGIDYSFNLDGNIVIRVNPSESKINQQAGGFRAQTREITSEPLIIVSSTSEDIGDGIVLLPTTKLGQKFNEVKKGSFKLSELKRGRPGEITLLQEDERDKVLDAFNEEEGAGIFQVPESWTYSKKRRMEWSDVKKATAIKKFVKAKNLTSQGIVRNLISADDVACVLVLPPFRNDKTKTVTYVPLTLGDMGLGAASDTIEGALSIDGDGFDFVSHVQLEWTPQTHRKQVSGDSSIKALALLSPTKLTTLSNGEEAAEMKAKDFEEKTLETTKGRMYQTMRLYHLKHLVEISDNRKIKIGRSLWFDADQNGNPKNREDVNPNLIAMADQTGVRDSYENTSMYREIREGRQAYKHGDFLDETAERVLRTVLKNMDKLGACPGKILSPMTIKDGKFVYKFHEDALMDMYFTNILEDERFLLLNYLTNGEFCPPDTQTLTGNYTMNYEYKVKTTRSDENEYKLFIVTDGLFNAENISILDNPSAAASYSMQQAVRKLAYTGASAYDKKAIANKQALDAEDYEALITTETERLERIYKRQQSEVLHLPPFVQSVKELADSIRSSTGAITNDDPWVQMDEAFDGIVKAYSQPAGLHRLNDEGIPVLLEETDPDWDRVETLFHRLGGFGNKPRWTRDRVKKFISHLMNYSAQDTGLDSFDIEEVITVIQRWGETLKKGNPVFPRDSIVSQPGDLSTARLGSCGRLGMLEEEWSIPNVKKLFKNDRDAFLKAAGDFQKSQIEVYRSIEGASEQKIRMYHYIQLFLQDELNDVIPGGVGNEEPLNWDGNWDKETNEILGLFGVAPQDASVREALKEYGIEHNREVMALAARDRGSYAVRHKNKVAKDGTVIRGFAGKAPVRSPMGNAMSILYSMRAAMGLFLNLPLTAANLTQTVVNGQLQKAANHANFFLAGEDRLSPKNMGVQPQSYDVISQAATDPDMATFFKLKQMFAFYDDGTILNGFWADPQGTVANIEASIKTGSLPQRFARKLARISSEMATGGGIGLKPMRENFLFRFGQYMGDTKWLSRHFVDQNGNPIRVTEPLMTKEKWSEILASSISLHDFLNQIADPADPMNLLYRAAMQDSLKITWARENLATSMLGSIMTSLGSSKLFPATTDTIKASVAITTTPYLKYFTNLAIQAMTAINGIPLETLMHLANYAGMDLKVWLKQNGVKSDTISRIDFEAMASSRSLHEAMMRDSIKFGGVWLLGLVAAGVLQFEEPEDDDLKDIASEYTIGNPLLRTADGEPFRAQLAWPLQDILGPFVPVAVYLSTVLKGNPRPKLLSNGMVDLLSNNATMTVSQVSAFVADPLMWQRETGDEDMGKMNGVNKGEEDPAITNTDKLYIQGVMALYRCFVPNSIDKALAGTPGTEMDASSNYIYEVDSSGKPTGRINPDTGEAYLEKTSEVDAAWRRASEKYPVLGYMLNFQNNVLGKGGTGYTSHEMPRVLRYNPFQMESSKIYEVTGDIVHDDQVAADVITMLASFDDLDELMETGFYVNAETRDYVGDKVWDEYNSLKEMIDQAKAEGLKDYKALGNGDYAAGEQIWSVWEQSIRSQMDIYKNFYYDKVDSAQLRQRMETANVIRQGYSKDANGEYYATGFRNDNPAAFVNLASRYGNAGSKGGWSSIDPLTDLPVGERGWVWNTANSFYDNKKFEEHAGDGNGNGYSESYVTKAAGSSVGTGTDLDVLRSVFNPDAKSGYSSYRKSGGGGGGSSYMPKLYSNPQDLNADRPTLARMDRLYDSQFDYVRPDWETKGSNKASRRSDI